MMAEEIALRSDSDPSPDLGACGGMATQKENLFGAAMALNGQGVRLLLLWSITNTMSGISLWKSLGRIGQVK